MYVVGLTPAMVRAYIASTAAHVDTGRASP